MHPKNYIKHLNKHGLSSEELWLCHCIFLWKIEDNDFKSDLNKYFEGNKTKFNYVILIDKLVEKNLLININKKGEIKVENLLTTREFEDIVVVDIEEAFNQVLKVYPDYLLVDGRRTLTKAVNLEDLKNYYNKFVIKGSRFAHEKFILLNEKYFEDVKYAKMGLDKWIRGWLAIESVIEKEVQDKIEDDEPQY